MNSSRALKIYIASSFRNLHAVEMLADRLTDLGHTVLDWTAFAPPLPSNMRPEERRAALASDTRGSIFEFCCTACAGADLVVYLGESGQDAACEVGIAFNAGVPVLGLRGPMEAPGLILARAVTEWHERVYTLLLAVERQAKENSEAGAA